MKDLLLTRYGDLYIDPATGDIQITDSVEQAIRIRLLWFWREWRLGPGKGIPYWEEIFVKNPNKLRLRQIFREAIMSVEEVVDVLDLGVAIDPATRILTVRYKARTTDDAEHGGEVHINA
jgi:hypothetical protein